MVHGKLAWEGSFAPENLTYEALGNDPTSGDPTRVSKAALYEGYPNTTFASKDAAWFMIQQVRKYPGQVSLYSAGALTNIALAIRMDPDFAKNAKELVIMVSALVWTFFQNPSTRTEIVDYEMQQVAVASLCTMSLFAFCY